MTYRERFQKTLDHQIVDRPPFDLDATPMTLLNGGLQKEMCALLGIPDENEGLLKALDIDFRRVGGMLTPESPLCRRFSDWEYTDCWGITQRYVNGDWQITENPLRGAAIQDLKHYPWPDVARVDPKVVQDWRQDARRLYEETDYVIVGEHPILGVMELGCWMCGFDEFLLKMALEPEFVQAFFQRVYEYQKDAIDLYYSALGEYLHVTTSGDDFGTQRAPFISPAMFSQLVAPYYDRRIALTRQYTRAAFFHHTCGSVFDLIPRMIESGVQILNPMQPNAKDMEPGRLKDAYGRQLTFWGGIDTQHVLPSGNLEEVTIHVKNVLNVFGRDGGYVFSPAHVLQRDVPGQNVIAMYRAAHLYYGV